MKETGSLPPVNLVRIACPVAAAACLAGGLALAGQMLAAAAALLAALAMLLTRRWPASWLATGSLAALVALAGTGLLLHAAPLLMLSGATAALAGWDLAFEAITRPVEGKPLAEVPPPAREEPALESPPGALVPPAEPPPPAVLPPPAEPSPPAVLSPPGLLLERYHLRSLALALGAGLLVAAIGQNVQLRLPFIVIAAAVGLGVWALERVLRSFV